MIAYAMRAHVAHVADVAAAAVAAAVAAAAAILPLLLRLRVVVFISDVAMNDRSRSRCPKAMCVSSCPPIK